MSLTTQKQQQMPGCSLQKGRKNENMAKKLQQKCNEWKGRKLQKRNGGQQVNVEKVKSAVQVNVEKLKTAVKLM